MRSLIAVAACLSVIASRPSPLSAQLPPDLARERSEYLRWLGSAPNSPLAAIALVRVGLGVRLGADSTDEVVLPGLREYRVIENDAGLVLQGPEGSRPLARGRPAALYAYTIVPSGPPGRTVVTLFGRPGAKKAAGFYAYDSTLVVTVALEPPAQPGTARVLAVDGTEVDGSEAGTVQVPIGTSPSRLLVRRIPSGAGEESDLEIYFRDRTSGKGSYPAGRFVNLIPLGGGRYRLDFNRARNPFCAYSSVYPCPAPWRGNTLSATVAAGERYVGGGLEPLPGALSPP